MTPSPPRYAYLGPAGTFTEEALHRVVQGTEAVFLPQADVVAAIEAVRTGGADYAVVAIESTVQGGVTATLDTLANGDELVLLREVLVPVNFSLVVAPVPLVAPVAPAAPSGGPPPPIDLTRIRRIAAHPHAWVQCRRWLAENLPDVVHIPATSNTAPAALLAQTSGAAQESGVGFDAALVPPAAVQHYGLTAIANDIADNADAMTRFVVVGRPGQPPAPTGADKTTLLVHLPSDEAGALLAMLEQFAARGVNLSRIESRPRADAPGQYAFSIDAEGHIAEERIGEALIGLHRVCPHVRYLGSYPRADAVPAQVRAGTTDTDFVTARTWLEALRSSGTGR